MPSGKRKDRVAPRYRLRVKQRTAIVTYALAHGVLPASGSAWIQDDPGMA
jgi:hypothetical protein